MRITRIRNLIKNLFSFSRYNFVKELSNVKDELRNTKADLTDLRTFIKIIKYYEAHPSDRYKKEISYLAEIGSIKVFPYNQIRVIENVFVSFDQRKKMPYVLHDKNKKLYFPQSWNIEEVRNTYINYIQVENILGGNYAEKSPHQYQANDFYVERGDVVLDIGAAEALFSLDIIDLVKKIYVFESDELWLEPLRATFEPYGDKVTIINKLVSDVDTGLEVRLESCIDLEDVQRLFIKMDIEGSEKKVLEGNLSLFKRAIDIKVVCCTYHKQNDAEDLNRLFNDIGYKTEFSDGFMIFIYDEDLKPPYFRNGLIRAHKKMINFE